MAQRRSCELLPGLTAEHMRGAIMVETSVQKKVEKYKTFQIEEIVAVYKNMDEFWHSISDILLRLQLVQSFSEYETEKLIGEEIQINAIALTLKDITQLLESEVDKFFSLHMELSPYDVGRESI